MHRMRRCPPSWLLLTAAFLLVLGGSGCTAFGRAWRQAPAPAPAEACAGRWTGSWQSEINGHHGRLRAVIVPLGPDRFRIHYRATYQHLLRFSYTMDIDAPALPDGTRPFRGTAKLGLWGTYRGDGQISPTEFDARYDAGFDRGTFTLRRPASGAP